MAANSDFSGEPSLTSLVGGILDDARNLVKQEIALARREIADEMTKTRHAVISLGIGVGITAISALLLILTLVHLLAEEANFKLWQSYGLVSLVLMAVGIGLLFLGQAKARSIHLVPQRTWQTLKDNVQWLKNRT